MKTEKEILEKYHRMLEDTIELKKIVSNPPDEMTPSEIIDKSNILQEQYHMNSLMEWVLDVKK